MPIEYDSTTEIIEEVTDVPLDLDKIVIKADSPINLTLANWEKGGLRIRVYISGLGGGDFNEKPYPDRETALREYRHVLEQVQKGNYSLELYGKEYLKLVLTDSE